MTVNGWLQIGVYLIVLTALVVPLGRYMARVFEGKPTVLSPVLRPLETTLYRLSGVDEAREQGWLAYTVAMLLFNAAGFLAVYALLRLQAFLPLNPTDQSAVPADLSFNTAVTHTFGRMVGKPRQGWALYAAMLAILVGSLAATYWAEGAGNVHFAALGIDPANMEGKEVRFGIANSSLWAVATTAASNGSVNAMHDSFTPLGGLVPVLLMQLGEIVFGGVGSGLYGMFLFVIVTVFVAGLMVGRTPEYLGKKIEAKEVKMAMLAVLCLPLAILGFTAAAVLIPSAVASTANAGPHGFSEILYAYTSQTANNGSAFAGLTGNTLWYNTTGGFAMLIGRYFVIVPAMAIAGSLAAKKSVAASAGTFPTDSGLFVGLLVGVILIVGGLTFFPALALGPIVEHIAMMKQAMF
ncbi:MAG: potassium-transporting ATPase subunit KdpA [Xanthobacteraceae bacterium]|uniref:potassium-transporting ATPase subunit KdpA n=1 Tax=Pseudolabrys sp. TaxID=1960880 RepID=UPI003D148CFD